MITMQAQSPDSMQALAASHCKSQASIPLEDCDFGAGDGARYAVNVHAPCNVRQILTHACPLPLDLDWSLLPYPCQQCESGIDQQLGRVTSAPHAQHQTLVVSLQLQQSKTEV